MSMVWIVIISYAIINLLAGILELIRKREIISQSIDMVIDELMKRTNSDLFKNIKFIKTCIVFGVGLGLIYDLLLWAPDNLARQIFRARRE